MEQHEKQRILSALASDIKKIVAREVELANMKNRTKIPSNNSIMSNAIANSNMVYSDVGIDLNQSVFDNKNVYQKMKNKIQFRNSKNSSTFVNKGIAKASKLK